MITRSADELRWNVSSSADLSRYFLLFFDQYDSDCHIFIFLLSLCLNDFPKDVHSFTYRTFFKRPCPELLSDSRSPRSHQEEDWDDKQLTVLMIYVDFRGVDIVITYCFVHFVNFEDTSWKIVWNTQYKC